MIIENAKLHKIIGEGDPPLNFNVPTIALVGRSNVGKSSFINSITGIKNLAKTSKEPGKTKTINYFNCNNGSFYFVDLPGYGYASVSKKQKESWSKMLGNFFSNTNNMSLVLLLIDARRNVTDNDKIMANLLYGARIPFVVVMTKTDLLKNYEIVNSKQRIAEQLAIGYDNIYMHSSLNKKWEKDMLKMLENIIAS